MARRAKEVLSRRFLPRDPRTVGPYRLTPSLALRIGVLGMLALVVFAVLFLRLWALQVLSGAQYLRAAQNNQLRTVRVQASRGPILDRYGRVLVTNRAGTEVQIWPSDLPKRRSDRVRELREVAKIVDVPLWQIAAAIRKHRSDLLTPVTVKTGASEVQVGYLWERREDFPGVRTTNTYLRSYPHGSLGAHILGYVTEISPAQVKVLAKQGYHPGDEIGQAGIEASYDRYLRGTAGVAKLVVDSLGRPRTHLNPSTMAHPGNAVRLTIDLKLQQAAERALQIGMEDARASQCYGCWNANGGAIVALDPRDGSVRALASWPTYNPSVYAGRVSLRGLDAAGLTPKTAQPLNYPALDRAVDAAYPPGSTWKPVTALAALEEGLITPYENLQCTGSYTVAGHTFNNWDPAANAWMDLRTAVAASCDTYFYRVGYRFYGLPARLGPRLQAWASRFGFGASTGVDLSPERTGLLPTPDWRKATYTKKTDPRGWEIDRLWKPGDSIQLAIGQKDLLVTPMQMARFYAMIANGGSLVTPHLLMDVEQPPSNGRRGAVLPTSPFAAPEPTNVDAGALEVVRQGLLEATHSPFGTSVGVFGGFPVAIAGKTGTAEKTIDPGDGYPRIFNQSWWCGYGPADRPTLVVCALIENGGHGGTAAAPAALHVFEEFFHTQVSTTGPVHSD
ncbi:MAG: penicillin-binding protein 2 [Actinobacteria bacterium]|nr:MAG: penicillin-binding protein 2 [Actinomycetota bacterium]